jgi:beta-lactamase superfamily II metal-dependent hydrolase
MALGSYDYLMMFLVMFGFMFSVYYFNSLVGKGVVLNTTPYEKENISLCTNGNCTDLKKQLDTIAKTMTTTVTTSTLRITVFNTSGALTSVISSNDTNVLINCGATPAVMDRLFMNGISLLKYIIIGGVDYEHAGGCERMLKAISHNMIYDNGGAKDEEWYIGYLFAVGNQRVIVNGSKDFRMGSMNVSIRKANNGMDVLMRSSNNTFLFSDSCGAYKDINKMDVAVCNDVLSEGVFNGSKPTIFVVNSFNESLSSVASKYGKTLFLKGNMGDLIIRTDGHKISYSSGG